MIPSTPEVAPHVTAVILPIAVGWLPIATGLTTFCAAIAGVIAAIHAFKAKSAMTTLTIEVNHRLTELLAMTKSAAILEGRALGTAQERKASEVKEERVASVLAATKE